MKFLNLKIMIQMSRNMYFLSYFQSPELEKEQMVYNRQQSRLLEFVCLSVIVPININAFTSNIMELVAYAVSILLFVVFNIFRVSEQIKYLRLLFLFALMVGYLPFFIFKK